MIKTTYLCSNLNTIRTQLINTIKALGKGNLILYPTDTVWGIGCDATDAEAVQKIYALKQRDDSKTMICLVSDFEMLNKYIENIPNTIRDILKKTTKPTTIIYNSPKHFAKNLIAEDNTIAIRIPNDAFCQELLKQFKKPIVSTSANISGFSTPQSFKEISDDIIKGVDYVVNLHHEKTNTNPSKIIKINTDGSLKVIRE